MWTMVRKHSVRVVGTSLATTNSSTVVCNYSILTSTTNSTNTIILIMNPNTDTFTVFCHLHLHA